MSATANLWYNCSSPLGGSVSFSSSEYSALEGAGSVAVTVELSVATEIDVVVELVTSAATASST